MVSKVFKNLVNNRIVDHHLEKFGLFSNFPYDFRSSRSTADLLRVVSNRIARAFMSRSSRAVALDISRLLTEFGMLVLFTNLSVMEFLVKYLALLLLFSVIGRFRWFWMGNRHKNIHLMMEFL